jgi:dienelactone hydrolase
MTMRSEDVEYRADELRCSGYLAFNEAAGRRPGILVVHAGTGLNAHIVERTNMIADLGYVAFAADLYGDRKQAVGLEAGRQLTKPLHDDYGLLRKRTRAGLDVLMSRPEVDPAQVGAIGFCFGGLAVLELARSGAPVAATTAFHGLLKSRNSADAHNIQGPLLICTGAEDPLVPPEDVLAFQQEMRPTKIKWQVNVYGGARHAFTNRFAVDDGKTFGYDEISDRRSWAAMESLFTEVFGTQREN